MRYFHRVFCLTLLGFSVLGCSREQAPGDVVASVCGQVLTASEVESRAQNIVLLFGHKRGSTNGLDRLASTFKAGYAAYWVEDTVLAAAARAAAVEPGTNELVRCRRQAFANFRTKKDRSYGDLMKIKGLDLRYWDDQVRAEALRATMQAYWAEQEPTNLPPDYAEQQVRQMEQWNRTMAETNRLQFAKATNVWQRICRGMDFPSAAKEFSEIEEERADAGEWAVVDAKFLSDEPALLAWLRAAKPGDISPPIAADNGILIARLDSLEQDEGFAVSRIFFRLGRILDPAPKDEIVAAAKKKYAQDLFKRKLAELVVAANADFPKKNTKDNEVKNERK